MMSNSGELEKPKMLPRKEDFTEWYNEILGLASIIDYSYPVKGMGVWFDYGWKLRNNIMNIMRHLLDETGHREFYFPFLIPENVFDKESELASGFEEEVYWVTKGGTKPLSVRLAIRPTSETSMYYMFSKWIRSYADLPLKAWQLVSIFRYETKATKPLIRVREVTSFKEAHTVHSTAEEAEQQVKEAIDVYKRFFDALCIPYVISKRPEYDTFPGAIYTIAFETIFPDGRTLQIGSVHFHAENFAKAFDIKYLDHDGKMKYSNTTCYGISERVIASVIAIHGDDHGLVFPPSIAPKQIAVVPISFESDPKVVEYAQAIYERVKEFYKAELDVRRLRPGRKFYDWELKGIPVRLEIGPGEVKDRSVTVFRRDIFKKEKVSLDDFDEYMNTLMESIARDMSERAWKDFNSKTHDVSTFFSFGDEADAISSLIDEETGKFLGSIANVPVCGDTSCELKIKEYVDVLGSPVEDMTPKGSCICGKEVTRMIRISRQY